MRKFNSIVQCIFSFVQWAMGVFGLCMVCAFTIPPLIGLGNFQVMPIAIGTLLVLFSALLEGFGDTNDR